MGPICGGAERLLPVSSLAIRRINCLFGMIPAAVGPLIVFFFSLPELVFRESGGGCGGGVVGVWGGVESGGFALEVTRPRR